MTVFGEFRRVKRQVEAYAGSMYWKREGAYEYLVKTKPRRRIQERLGARSEQTERTFMEYISRKKALESRLQSLREALTEAEPMNKALKTGRTPDLVVRLLQALEMQGCSSTLPSWAHTPCMPTKRPRVFASRRAHWPRKTSTCCGMRAGCNS
ncbi:hypothetical protein LJR130_004893 [Variovorax sp. LjRoot130]